MDERPKDVFGALPTSKRADAFSSVVLRRARPSSGQSGIQHHQAAKLQLSRPVSIKQTWYGGDTFTMHFNANSSSG
jgi:hypothetical protein